MSGGAELEVDLARCCACRACELACSFHLTGAFNPSASAVLVSYERHTGAVDVVFAPACDLCQAEPGGPRCIAHCPLQVVRISAPSPSDALAPPAPAHH